MPLYIFKSPDAPAGGATPEKKSHAGYIPTAEDDLLTVATNVNDTWELNTQITLVFTTQAEFKVKVDMLKTKLKNKKDIAKYRPGQTNSLDTLDTEIDQGVSSVKRYLEEKYDTGDASPYFPVMGIEHKGKRWLFPIDRDKRRDALQTMVTGIAAEGLGAKKFGAAFWNQMANDYDTALISAQKTDRSVSDAVRDFNQLKDDITLVLQGLLFVLRGNYQKT